MSELRQKIAIDAMMRMLASGKNYEPNYLSKKAVACADALMEELGIANPKVCDQWIWFGGEKVSVKKALIEDMDFKPRAINCLADVGVTTVHDLLQLTELDVRRVRGLGKTSQNEVFAFVAEHGLMLK